MDSNNVATQTTTVETKTEKEETVLLEVRYPVFLMFAEYLGYVSPLLDWAQELCDGKDIPTYQRSILMVDARSIMHKMMEECPREQVLKLFQDYYDVILNEYDDNVAKIEKARTDDLPF